MAPNGRLIPAIPKDRLTPERIASLFAMTVYTLLIVGSPRRKILGNFAATA